VVDLHVGKEVQREGAEGGARLTSFHSVGGCGCCNPGGSQPCPWLDGVVTEQVVFPNITQLEPSVTTIL
jgi:hypothetical protein